MLYTCSFRFTAIFTLRPQTPLGLLPAKNKDVYEQTSLAVGARGNISLPSGWRRNQSQKNGEI
jgi:hypothetical protein